MIGIALRIDVTDLISTTDLGDRVAIESLALAGMDKRGDPAHDLVAARLELLCEKAEPVESYIWPVALHQFSHMNQPDSHR